MLCGNLFMLCGNCLFELLPWLTVTKVKAQKAHIYIFFIYIYISRFTPCKAEQPLQDIELQEKRSTKRLKHTGSLFRKKLQLMGVC